MDFDLLDRQALNENKMFAPDQYLHDPIGRAQKFFKKVDH
jgi:hypothetical protein